MISFKEENIKMPLNTVWLMNTISECKGKQELYSKQAPEILNSLLEMAMIESAESSNRIEGVTVKKDRLKPLLLEHSKPRDRSEEEVAGYREALDFIHKNNENIRITPEYIKHLHSLTRGTGWDAGKWKVKDNDIIKKYPDGRIEVIFKPVKAEKVPQMIEQLCLAYEQNKSYPPLYAIACLILDFLSIHPFRDGNGRVGRLLTLAALYQHGFYVGKYISLERIVERSKETYYETLNDSSEGWHEGKHNTFYWTNYFLGTLIAAYGEFNERAFVLKPERGAKREMIIAAVKKQFMKFSIANIQKELPGISRVMIKKVLLEMKNNNEIESLGKGRTAKWIKKEK